MTSLLSIRWKAGTVGSYKMVKVVAATCETRQPTLESPIAVEVTDAAN
jgi:hypothetical protein